MKELLELIQRRRGWGGNNPIKNQTDNTNTYFFQRKHTNGQQACENMLNITNNQGNANINHNEISAHPCQNSYCQKSVIEDAEKREPENAVGGNVN